MPNSVGNAEVVVVTDRTMRGRHHAEVLIMSRDREGPGGAGTYYDSLGVEDEVPDEEFDARFRALDAAALKEQYGGDGVRFNGPRRFLADRFTAQAFDGGRLSMLGPIPMHLCGTFIAPDFDAFVAGKQVPYREAVSRRSTEWCFDAGSEVYELVSPSGDVVIMQSASLGVDPGNTVDRLPALGQRLAVPDGWSHRVRTLEKELVVRATYDDSPGVIVLDELEDNHQRIDNT